MASYDVILPAGGPIKGPFGDVAGTPWKALIQFSDETILQRTLRVLRAHPKIGRLVVIGPDEVLNHPGTSLADLKITPGNTGPDNIFLGLDALKPASTDVLIVTTDLPFLDEAMIDRFIAACPDSAEICGSLVSQASYEAAFPNSTATFVTLAGESYTLGGIYRMNSAALSRMKPEIDRVFAQRKSKLGMAKLLGLAATIKFVRKTLTLDQAIGRVEQILRCKIHAVLSDPHLAYDIDDQEDYDYAVASILKNPS